MTTDQWAAFFSGSYQGWARQPSGEWEDLIGSVKFVCAAHEEGGLRVTVTTIEFGAWDGRLQVGDMVLEGSTGQGDTYFKCAFNQAENRFEGAIYEPPATPLLEFQFVRNPK